MESIKQFKKTIKKSTLDLDKKKYLIQLLNIFEKTGLENSLFSATERELKNLTVKCEVHGETFLEEEAKNNGLVPSRFSEPGILYKSGWGRIGNPIVFNYPGSEMLKFDEFCKYAISFTIRKGEYRLTNIIPGGYAYPGDSSNSVKFDSTSKEGVEKGIEKLRKYLYTSAINDSAELISNKQLETKLPGFSTSELNSYYENLRKPYITEIKNFLSPYLLTAQAYSEHFDDLQIRNLSNFFDILSKNNSDFTKSSNYTMIDLRIKNSVTEKGIPVIKVEYTKLKDLIENDSTSKSFMFRHVLIHVLENKLKTLKDISDYINNYFREKAVQLFRLDRKRLSLEEFKQIDEFYTNGLFPFLTSEEREQFKAHKTVRKFNL